MVYKISLGGYFCWWTIPTEVTTKLYLINHVSVEVLTTVGMILSWINSPPTEVTTQWYLINHVSVEVMTTGRMIRNQYLYTDMVYKISLGGYFCWWTINPREYHPSYLINHVSVEVLTTGRMILSWINSPPTEVTTQWYLINHVSVEVLTTGRMIPLHWHGL
jgi:hypothetical protein